MEGLKGQRKYVRSKVVRATNQNAVKQGRVRKLNNKLIKRGQKAALKPKVA
jgi:hypothetical protein